MVWQPNPTVTIGGVDYTGDTLETVRIDRGRDNVFAEPRAGYLVCELIDQTGTGLDFDVLDTITVTLDDSNGQPVTVYAGNVSDWTSRLYDTGFESGSPRSITTIIAVSALAQLNRRNVAQSGLPAGKDGDRMFDLIKQGLAITYEEFPATTFEDMPADLTFEQVDPDFDPTLIDRPGVFDIAPLPADDQGYNPLSQGYLTAFSGRGVLFDTREGFVAYADNDRRENDAEAGYLELPAAIMSTAQLTTRSQFADIVNRVGLTFEGGSVRVSDEQSIIAFGVLARQFETNLADQTAAELWAVDYLEDHAGPVINLSGVAIRLDTLTDDGLRDLLVEIEVGTPVSLQGLPGTLGLTALPAFVEGVSWRIDRERVNLSLDVSDAALSIGSIRYGLVPASLRFEDVDATLRYQDARRL